MKAKCRLTGVVREFTLLDAIEYKKDHPTWGSFDSMKHLGRPLLFEGKRWCFRGYGGGWISIPPDKFESEYEPV